MQFFVKCSNPITSPTFSTWASISESWTSGCSEMCSTRLQTLQRQFWISLFVSSASVIASRARLARANLCFLRLVPPTLFLFLAALHVPVSRQCLQDATRQLVLVSVLAILPLLHVDAPFLRSVCVCQRLLWIRSHLRIRSRRFKLPDFAIPKEFQRWTSQGLDHWTALLATFGCSSL